MSYSCSHVLTKTDLQMKYYKHFHSLLCKTGLVKALEFETYSHFMQDTVKKGG